MHALREKFYGRFSSLFSYSTSSDPPKSLPPDPHTQVRPSKGRKSLSSYLSLIIPSKHGSKPTDSRQDTNAVQTPSVRYSDANNDFQEEGSDAFLECSILCKAEEIPHNQGETKVCGSAHEKVKLNELGVDDDPPSGNSNSSSDVFEEAMERPTPRNPLPDIMDESAFITADLYDFLGCCLPNIVKGCQWVLLYSTMKHGISLQTLIRKSHDLSGPCLLIVGDTRGAIFGGLLECPLKPTAKRKYQGTHQTFVFTTKYGDPRLFRATGANRYYYICLNDLLALGGGGSFALRLDGDLLSGTSGPCDTFDSVCLAHDLEFELKNVELWGFAHASRYLT
ncbi:TLD domain-containing protein 2-like isoform X2 [Cucurbita maxima]|uniref:TLD domain-containing protein 2-like isoform X2 n=1 Tax=Cucurbita maxima TaxID=3661 RepID=A0A6J1KZ69_CUCMA|nr:TLD domain-containing protein 2-like isoform X2 [Cucurbita maxima]